MRASTLLNSWILIGDDVADVSVLAVYTFSVVGGRLYTGMHSIGTLDFLVVWEALTTSGHRWWKPTRRLLLGFLARNRR